MGQKKETGDLTVYLYVNIPVTPQGSTDTSQLKTANPPIDSSIGSGGTGKTQPWPSDFCRLVSCRGSLEHWDHIA